MKEGESEKEERGEGSPGRGESQLLAGGTVCPYDLGPSPLVTPSPPPVPGDSGLLSLSL